MSMLKFLHNQSKTVIGAAALVGVLSFASRLMGLIRDRILAGAFGAGDTLDIYYAAFKIPDLLFQLIVVGAVSASFIPLFLRRHRAPGGGGAAWIFANNALHLVVGAMLAVSLLLALFADPLASLVAPGFGAAKQARVAEFMRVMFAAQVLLAASMVYGSVLQSLKRFFLYALSPILYNVGIIVGAVWFVRSVGAIGLAWGVVLGAALHLAVQLAGVRGQGYRYRFVADARSPDAREIARLMAPRTLGIAVAQLLFVLLAIIASTMGQGSVTVLQFAYNIQFFPVGIVGVSFAIAVFPALCERAGRERVDAFIDTLISTTRQLLYLLVPLTLLFLVLRIQIVRVVVGSGAFDWDATRATADALAFFALTFIPQALVFVLARAFYAMHDTVTVLLSALVSALVGILSALLLRDAFGVTALSMAFGLASTVNAAMLWISLRQRVGTLRESTLVPLLFQLCVCGMAAGLAMQFLKPVAVSVIGLETFAGVFFQGLFAGGIGLAVYVALAHVLRVPEQEKLFANLRRRTLARVVQPEPIVE